VRELDLLTRRLVALHGNEPLLRRSFLPEALRDKVAADAAPPQPAAGSVDRDEHDLQRLAEELRRHELNVTRAAAAAGISRSRAYRLMGGRSPQQFLAELGAVKTAR
jgi:transcriptional regulator of acetoin/glycerol metabolism